MYQGKGTVSRRLCVAVSLCGRKNKTMKLSKIFVSASRDQLSTIGSSVAGGLGGSVSLTGWED